MDETIYLILHTWLVAALTAVRSSASLSALLSLGRKVKFMKFRGEMGREAWEAYVSSKPGLILLVTRCWTRCLTSLGLSFGGAGFDLEGPFQVCDLYSGEKIEKDLHSSYNTFVQFRFVSYFKLISFLFLEVLLVFLVSESTFPMCSVVRSRWLSHDCFLRMQVSLTSSRLTKANPRSEAGLPLSFRPGEGYREGIFHRQVMVRCFFHIVYSLL